MKGKIVIAAMAALLAACGKPQNRPMVSDANAQHAPAAQYQPQPEVPKQAFYTEGCLVTSPGGETVISLLMTQTVEKFGEESVVIRQVGRSDRFNFGHRRDEAFATIVRQWGSCINNLGRGAATFLRSN